MVLEQIINVRSIQQHPEYSLYMGVLSTLISFVTAFFIFKNASNLIGIATILFIVILIIPFVSRLFVLEERAELTSRLTFFQRHKTIMNFFLYFFIGSFVCFFVLSLAFPSLVFSKDQLYGAASSTKLVVQQNLRNLPPIPSLSPLTTVFNIFENNMFIMLLSFLLSLFYGSGALFLIVLNASVFASALADIIRIHTPLTVGYISQFAFSACNIGIIFFHMIPEVGGYLIAAIAGGVLSAAFVREKKKQTTIAILLKTCIPLVLGALALLFIAAFIEVFISQRLFLSNTCITNTVPVLLIALALIIIVIVLEIKRKPHE